MCSFRQDVVWSFFLPYCPMLAKKQKQNGKIQISNFVNLYTTLVETLPRSIHTFLEVNLLKCTFRRDVVWSFFFHVKENEKKNRKKSKMQNFEKQNKTKNKNGLEIWWKGPSQPNLGLICLTGSEKTGFTNNGQTPSDDADARVTTVALLCSSTKQSWKMALKLPGSKIHVLLHVKPLS